MITEYLKDIVQEGGNKNVIVFSGSEDYVCELNKLEITGLKRETADIDPQYEGYYREPYNNEKPDKEFIVFSYRT